VAKVRSSGWNDRSIASNGGQHEKDKTGSGHLPDGSGPAFGATFVNGGFELGNLNGWTEGGGCWGANVCTSVYNPVLNTPGDGSLLPTAAVYVGGTPNNTVVGVGTDPITGAATVYNGSYAVRVNDSINDWSVSTISQSVTNYTDNFIYFAWNAVLESSHGLDDSDYFSLVLRDDTTGTDVVSRSYSSAGSVGGGTSGVTWTTYGSWFSSGWVIEQIDVAGLGLVGHDFTLSLLASDCRTAATPATCTSTALVASRRRRLLSPRPWRCWRSEWSEWVRCAAARPPDAFCPCATTAAFGPPFVSGLQSAATCEVRA